MIDAAHAESPCPATFAWSGSNRLMPRRSGVSVEPNAPGSRLQTPTGVSVTSAIPPVFDDYATVVIPKYEESGQPRHDQAVITVLRSHALDEKWWLGYLQRGGSDVIFPDAPTVGLYSRWPYVLVQAGPVQAANWRQSDEKPLTPYNPRR
jgi:hypothetical protein